LRFFVGADLRFLPSGSSAAARATSSAASSAVAKCPRYTRLPSRPTRASNGFTLFEVLTYTPTKPVWFSERCSVSPSASARASAASACRSASSTVIGTGPTPAADAAFLPSGVRARQSAASSGVANRPSRSTLPSRHTHAW